jgi:V8-like Glu-specific endopeptidase
MPKFIYHLLLGCLLSTACACSSQNKEDQINAVRDSIVSITLRSASGIDEENSLGTGFFIDKNLIVTALHVYEDHEEDLNKLGEGSYFIARKSSRDKKRFVIPLNLVSVDRDYDLVIFSFEPADIKAQWQDFVVKPLVISEEEPKSGEEITLSGYHSDYLEPTSSTGIIAQVTEEDKILSDLTVVPGMSGSLLVSFKTNKVVGVNVRVTLVRGAPTRLALSIKSRYLSAFLSRIRLQNRQPKLPPDN